MLLSNLMTDNLRTLLQSLMDTVPRLLGAIVFLVLGLIIARIVSGFVGRMLRKIGLDKLGEKLNDIEMVSKSNFDIKLSAIASKIIYYLILLIFVVAATDIVGMPAVSNLFNDIINWIPNFMVALIILILGLLFSEIIRKAVFSACDSFGIPSARLISILAFYFLFINIVISALAQAKVDTTFIASNISIVIGAVAFAFAIGYGLASKDVVANFLASYYTRTKFALGDKIKIKDTVGTIIDMDRSTLTIRTEEGQTIVPLNLLSNERVHILKQE